MTKYYWAKGNVKEKLLHFVKKQPNGCWEWTGPKNVYGYGRICFNSKSFMAHRVSYEIFKGKLGRLNACHTCDNPICVNPDHLFAGNQKQNMADCRSKNRIHHGERTGGSKLTADVVSKIIAAGQSKKYSHSEIAEMFSISRSHVGQLLSGKQWQHIGNGLLEKYRERRDALGGRLKVTLSEVKAIERLNRSGYGPTEIGHFFDVSRSCVHRILKRSNIVKGEKWQALQ